MAFNCTAQQHASSFHHTENRSLHLLFNDKEALQQQQEEQ